MRAMEGMPYQKPIEEKARNFARMSVTPEMVFTILFKWKDSESIALPVLDLPEDVRILGIYFIPSDRTFDIYLESEEFDLVPPGAEAPRIDWDMSWEVIKLPKDDDG